MGILDKVFGKKIKVPVAYDSKFHYNCFIETVPDGDRQAVYQELHQAGLVEFSHVLPDGRLQLSVRNIGTVLKLYNAVAMDKVFAAELTRAGLIELMVNNPDMEMTFLMHTSNPHVDHAEKVHLAQIIIASESAFRRGVEYHEQQHYQRAIECYDDAIRIEPEDVRAWYNKIGALAQQGKHQAALEVADEILALHDNVGILWEAKGQTLVDMGKLPEAGECMSKACALNPNIAKRHAQAVDQEADKWFQALMEECRRKGKNPETDIGFWWAKFAVFANSGDPDRMFLCLQMAATIGPEHFIMFSDAGMLLLTPGDPLLSKELLPDDAKIERLKDYFQRMVVKIKDKRPTAYLKDENKEVHTKAIRTLGEIGEPAIGSLIEAFKDENNKVCKGIMATLYNIGEPAVNPLIMAIKDENEKVRYYAAITLGMISESVAVNPLPLIDALRDENEKVRDGAIYALIEIGKPAVEPLIRALKDENKDVRTYAIRALGKIGEPAVEPLIRILKDENMNARLHAAFALGKIGEPAIESLIKALKDENEDVRKMAVVALEETGDAQAREYLSQASTDESETFREFAKAVLEMKKAEKS